VQPTDLTFARATDVVGEQVRARYVLLCAALLAPISLMIFEDGVSANYLFAILLISPRGYQRNYQAAAYVAFMILALAIGVVLFSHFYATFLARQFISFTLALLGVALLFVRLSIRLEELLVATVVCAVAYSLTAFYMFSFGGFSLADIYMVKGGMREFITDWPQRYVIVLLFAFFVALSRWSRGLIWPAANLVILACIFLTFTRAAWLGTAAGLLAYVALLLGGRRSGTTGGSRTRQRIVVVAGVVLTMAALSYAALDQEVAAAVSRLYDEMVNTAETNPQDYKISEGEGDRLDLYSHIIDTIEGNPFTGTGFAGAYLVIAGEGSAHGQYWDTLLRTGVIGLVIYLLFWVKLLRYYVRVDIGVTAGLIALGVFGCFHETTKLSYGALIFYFLLNKAYEGGQGSGRVGRSGPVVCAA
jgi:O-antigen ligase